MVLYARYYEQTLWFCMLGYEKMLGFGMLGIMNKRYGSYARYYEKIVGLSMLDIMNKCNGSVFSVL